MKIYDAFIQISTLIMFVFCSIVTLTNSVSYMGTNKGAAYMVASACFITITVLLFIRYSKEAKK
jgi:hypothetical protein